MIKHSQAQLDELLNRGIAEVIDRGHLQKRLLSGERLRLKLGIDPTGARLHLGHAVALRLLRRFQDLGHTAILIIGDFTARIGDPSGRDTMRQPLTTAQAEANARTYARQAFKILDQNRTEIRKNAAWLSKLTTEQLIREAAHLSAGWIYSHDTFRERLKSGKPLGFHELWYPLLQAYDSVAVKADVELGGIDQKFNLVTGRELMKAHGMEPQDIILTKYLIGTDGEKMGKSLDNYIALEEEPFEMFGKIMSMPDTVLHEYFELATDVPIEDLGKMHFSGTEARNTKMFLARKLVEQYHGVKASQEALRRWKEFVKGRTAGTPLKPELLGMNLRDVVVGMGLVKSKSEAQRLFEQGGVLLDGKVEKDWQKVTSEFSKGAHTLTVGKRKKTITLTV